LQNNDQILIAKLTAPHGLKGEMRGQFFTDNFDSFIKLVPDTLKNIRQSGNDTFIAQAASDRTTAEQMIGTEIFSDRTALPAAGANEYYVSDLIGMEVAGVGRVVAVHNFGAGDILEIEIPGAPDTEMLSFAGAKVDMENKKIEL
jgi:16S rRNA processing protein RimM